jgi:rRNA pseudouridine-1189 N-methylase Emg1 (Nep1/Mra1 family)
MNKNTNATKGHQGFVKSYPKLGKTVSIRVPESFEDFIKQMLSLCEQVEKIDPDHNKKLQKLAIKYLNNVISSSDNNV